MDSNQKKDQKSPNSRSSSLSLHNYSHKQLGFFSSLPVTRRYSVLSGDPKDDESSRDESYRFVAMAVLTSSMMLAEIVVGVISGSLTLLSDALHMLSDFIALMIGWYVHKMARKSRVNTNKNDVSSTNARAEHAVVYMRYEIVGALVNGIILLTSCLIMGLEAVQRIAFQHQAIDDVMLVLIVGAVGLLINIIGLVIFGHHHHGHSHEHTHEHGEHDHEHEKGKCNHDHVDDEVSPKSAAYEPCTLEEKEEIPPLIINMKSVSSMADTKEEKVHEDEDMNMHAVFLHVLSDALGSIAVIVSMLVIEFTDGWWNEYIDPVCTLFMVSLIARTALPLVRTSIYILLDKSPLNIDISLIEKQLINISGVYNVHELHVWQIKPGYCIGTVHLVIDAKYNEDDHTSEYCEDVCNLQHTKMTIMDQAKYILHMHDIHSSFVQREYLHSSVTNLHDWKKSNDPCLDFVCNDSANCKKQMKALSSVIKIRNTIDANES